jgi:hypothetical protein
MRGAKAAHFRTAALIVAAAALILIFLRACQGSGGADDFRAPVSGDVHASRRPHLARPSDGLAAICLEPCAVAATFTNVRRAAPPAAPRLVDGGAGADPGSPISLALSLLDADPARERPLANWTPPPLILAGLPAAAAPPGGGPPLPPGGGSPGGPPPDPPPPGGPPIDPPPPIGPPADPPPPTPVETPIPGGLLLFATGLAGTLGLKRLVRRRAD